MHLERNHHESRGTDKRRETNGKELRWSGMSWRSCTVRSKWDEYTRECTSLFGISCKSRDDLVGVLRWVGMSQQSCEDVRMRFEYTWKCTKLWRCQGTCKRHVHVWGHMIVKVMCQIGAWRVGMYGHGVSVHASMSYNMKRKSCNIWCPENLWNPTRSDLSWSFFSVPVHVFSSTLSI